MDSNNYITKRKQDNVFRTTNVVDLINRVRSNQRKEKRNNIIITAAAISALAVTGLIISL